MPHVAAALSSAARDARLWAVVLVALAFVSHIPAEGLLGPFIYSIPLFIGFLLFLAAWKYLKPPLKTEEVNTIKVGAAHKDPQTERDLLLLLDFAVYQTTAELLDSLIKTTPQRILTEPLVLAAERYEEATKYLQQVRSKLAGSHRMSNIANLLHDGEWQAEQEIREKRPEERPVGIDPLDLRKWAIANRQCWLVHQYLISQLAEVKETIAHQRAGLVERLSLRST